MSTELHAADSTLAVYYDTALRRAAAPAELRQAQAQWNGFRDADCHAIGAQYQGGSLAPIAEGQCRVDLANDRTHELWSIYLRITEDPLPEPGVRE
ncbi:MAG TPA: lysozyme inhibitor LprI family protein, partial [Gemmatimonadales bacterium]|nr:lysozyme inhibitor LprI family protein [Gemmatimonadales bacterium]